MQITLTEQEMQALAGLIDAGVKAIGLRAVKDAAAILSKMEGAANETSEISETQGIESNG